MLKRRVLLVSIGLVLLLGLFSGMGVMAQGDIPEDAVGFYTKDGEVHWIVPGAGIDITDLSGMTPADLEALFPMSAEAEAAIVHQVPPRPVVIDGVPYEADGVSLFDGQRLRFIVGNDRVLYAFTTMEGLEQFKQEQYGQPTPQGSSMAGGQSLLDTLSMFYEDWWYGGDYFGLAPGYGLPYLYQIGFDDMISSVQVNSAASWAYLFDYVNYGGDYFAMEGGTNWPVLSLYGWNDRASSVAVYE